MWGGIDPWDHRLVSWFVGIVDINFPVSGATSTLAGGATLAARWIHEPQPISNQPLWLGVPHCAGWY